MKKNPINNIARNILYKYLIKNYLSEGLILDIGCGEGVLTDKLTNSIGLDISPNILKEYPSDNRINGTAVNLPFKNNTFSGIFSGDVIEHISNPFDLTYEANRVLKLNSYLVILTPYPHDKFWDEPTHIRPYTPKALRVLFSRSGFLPIKTFRLNKTSIGVGKKIKNPDSKDNKFTTTDKILYHEQY